MGAEVLSCAVRDSLRLFFGFGVFHMSYHKEGRFGVGVGDEK